MATVHDEICIEVPRTAGRDSGRVQAPHGVTNTFLRLLDCQMDVPIVAGPSRHPLGGVHDLHDEGRPASPSD